MRRPTLAQLEIAAAWLEVNDSGNDPDSMDEQKACQDTADWLIALVEKAENETHIRRIMRNHPDLTKAMARKVHTKLVEGEK